MNFRLIPLWQKAAAALVVLVLLLSLSYCQGRADGKAGMQAKIAEAVAKVERRNRVAQERAAEQRVKDELANAKTMEERNEIIADAPGGVVSPADRALACDRLRRAGYSGSELPIPCRPAISNGAKAPAQSGNRN